MTAPACDPNFYRRPEVFEGGQILVNNRGEPIPPTDVVERLALIDERLSIEWVEGAWGCAYFGLFERWRQGDPRWARVQSGEVSAKSARDLVHMFQRSCPASEMGAYVENHWGNRAVVDPVKAAMAAVERAQKSLEAAKEAAVDKAVNVSMDRFDSETAHARRMRSGNDTAHPMVPGADFTEPKRLIEVVSR